VQLTGIQLRSGSRPDRLVLPSGPLDLPSPGVVRTRIDVASGGFLGAEVQANGLTTRLYLLDAHGRELVRSDGGPFGESDNRIEEHVTAGTYVLEVERSAGAGSYTLA